MSHEERIKFMDFLESHKSNVRITEDVERNFYSRINSILESK